MDRLGIAGKDVQPLADGVRVALTVAGEPSRQGSRRAEPSAEAASRKHSFQQVPPPQVALDQVAIGDQPVSAAEASGHASVRKRLQSSFEDHQSFEVFALRGNEMVCGWSGAALRRA